MYQIVGKKEVDYFSEKHNKRITGVSLYVIYESQNVEGFECTSLFISSSLGYKISDFALNSSIEVFYNKFGKVADIRLQLNI